MRVIIKNLIIETILGVYDYEKKKKFFTINLEIEFDSGKSEFSDNIEDTLSYSTIEKIVVNLVINKDYNLIESLSRDILDTVLQIERVSSCLVSVEKKGCTKHSESIIMENFGIAPN